MFTDNLYYPLVAAAVVAFWRMGASQSWQSTLSAGVLGGLATLTRPSMFFVAPLILGWVLRSPKIATASRKRLALVFCLSWAGVIGLVTFRNWIVSGRFVLNRRSSVAVDRGGHGRL